MFVLSGFSFESIQDLPFVVYCFSDVVHVIFLDKNHVAFTVLVVSFMQHEHFLVVRLLFL